MKNRQSGKQFKQSIFALVAAGAIGSAYGQSAPSPISSYSVPYTGYFFSNGVNNGTTVIQENFGGSSFIQINNGPVFTMLNTNTDLTTLNNYGWINRGLIPGYSSTNLTNLPATFNGISYYAHTVIYPTTGISPYFTGYATVYSFNGQTYYSLKDATDACKVANACNADGTPKTPVTPPVVPPKPPIDPNTPINPKTGLPYTPEEKAAIERDRLAAIAKAHDDKVAARTRHTEQSVAGAIAINIVANEVINPALEQYGAGIGASVGGNFENPEVVVGVSVDLEKHLGEDFKGASVNAGWGVESGELSVGARKTWQVADYVTTSVGASVGAMGVRVGPELMLGNKEFGIGVALWGPIPVPQIKVFGYTASLVPHLALANAVVGGTTILYKYASIGVKERLAMCQALRENNPEGEDYCEIEQKFSEN